MCKDKNYFRTKQIFSEEIEMTTTSRHYRQSNNKRHPIMLG